jgi:hypothetical protein
MDFAAGQPKAEGKKPQQKAQQKPGAGGAGGASSAGGKVSRGFDF